MKRFGNVAQLLRPQKTKQPATCPGEGVEDAASAGLKGPRGHPREAIRVLFLDLAAMALNAESGVSGLSSGLVLGGARGLAVVQRTRLSLGSEFAAEMQSAVKELHHPVVQADSCGWARVYGVQYA